MNNLIIVFDPVLKVYYLKNKNSLKTAYSGILHNDLISAQCELIRINLLNNSKQ